MLKFKKILRKNVIYILLFVIFITIYLITTGNEDNEIKIQDTQNQKWEEPVENSENNTGKIEEKMIYIDLKGEVEKPGVYAMKPNSRVKDVLNEAGGFTTDADPLLINMAQLLVDEMVIYVPKKGEIEPVTINSQPSLNEKNLLNINKASSSELESLDGIGPAKAEAIISYRNENGNFKKTEELMNVSGIGEGVFNQIKDKVTVK